MVYILKCKLRQFSFIAALAVFICTSTGVVWAQQFTIEPTDINRYNQQIEDAKSVENQLDSSLSCTQTYQQDVLTQTNGLEKDLGILLTNEKDYTSDVAKYEEEYKGFAVVLEKETKNYAILEQKRRQYEAKKEAEKRAVKECKSLWWTVNATCDWANEFGKFVGLIDNVDSDLKASRIRANGAKTRYQQSYAEFTNSQQKLAQAQKESSKLKSQIDSAEVQIVNLKKQSSILAIQRQETHKTIDEFNETLKSAQNISTDDMKRRALLKMEQLSKKIKALMVSAPDILRQTNAVLPNNGLNCSR